MKSLSFFIMPVLALGALAWPPRAAHACSPPRPELTSSIPATGETYPANAALFFQGYDIALDAVTVTVDGQPATLTPATDVSSRNLAAIAARVTPTPSAGQAVRVIGNFCPEAECLNTEIAYVAGPPDATPPSPPSAISFDVHDYRDFESSGGDCQTSSDAAWWIHVDAAPASAAESRVVVTVEGARNASFTDIVFASSRFVTSATTTIGVRRMVDEALDDPLSEAFCVRASLRDAAGNVASETVQACRPCRLREDDTMPGFGPPEEPEWSDDDIYDGGSCDGGGGDDGGDDGGTGPRRVGGCSCTFGAGDTSGATLGWVVALAASLTVARRAARRSRQRVAVHSVADPTTTRIPLRSA